MNHKICIDPGHPSYFTDSRKINWGCVENGIKEVELNLELSLILKSILDQRGYSTILTRTDNTQVVTNQQRVEIANNFGSDLLLRIHADSSRYKDTSVSGVRTFYPPPEAGNISEVSWDIALAIHRQIISQTNLVDRGVNDERVCHLQNEYGMLVGSYQANLYKIPTILIETVYLSNQTDAEWISQTKHQNQYMSAVADGLDSLYKQT